MRKAAAKKLRGRAGESISETLVALLISSLALLMLAGAVGAASRAVLQSKTKMEEYYGADKEMAEEMAEQSSGAAFQVSLRDISEETGTLETFSYVGRYYINDEFGRTAVVSYVAADDSPQTGEEGP